MPVHKKWLFAAFVAIVCLLLFSQRIILFQEGNPLSIGWVALKLELTEEELVLFSEQPTKYLVPAETKGQPFFLHMEQHGWTFVEQMGAGLVFKKEGETRLATERMWTKRYMVIVVSED